MPDTIAELIITVLLMATSFASGWIAHALLALGHHHDNDTLPDPDTMARMFADPNSEPIKLPPDKVSGPTNYFSSPKDSIQ